MTDLPMNQTQLLERRYRRLLTCYPVEHRRVYGEEMIGVLLAATPNGQRRPDLADTLSMFGGGLRVRLRGLVTGSLDPAWSNALALATLIVPVLLAVLAWQQIGLLGPPGSPQSASTERLAEVAFLLVPLALGLLKLRNLACGRGDRDPDLDGRSPPWPADTSRIRANRPIWCCWPSRPSP